jgi:predicted nucleic acid-binding protein
VRIWASALPPCCEVRSITATPEAALSQLDAGEREAIQLALDSGVDTLLMDESEGRRVALHYRLKVTGTLAILENAGQRGLVDFRATLEHLEQTSFRLSAAIRAEFLRRNP